LTDVAAKSFLKTLALFAAIAGLITAPAIAGDGRPSVDWPAYNGSTANTHYSSLTQINTGNVSRLKEVWRFDTGEMGGLETSPLIIDGVLYAYTPKQKVIALNAATGASLWTFDPQTEFPAEKIGSRAERGLSYWRHGADRRILAGASHYIYAIDGTSGKIIRTFGKDGRIDLKENLRGDPKTLSVTITSPGVVYRDLFIVGCGTPESLPAPPGDIRAFDVRTGKLRWTFHTIPHPGEFGYDTWPKDAWLHSGAANNWTGMALDQARGIVYVPTGSAATDWYGADRIGDNLFANSLIALDAATGKRIWHFQGVRHDLWDRDFPSPPSLVTVRRGGKDVPAIVQTSKQGFVFVFNRVTGEPLFPIEYRKVPASDVPGEVAATTQPFPTLPAPLSRQMLTEDDMTHRTPEAHQWAVEQFRKFNYTGQFTPNKVGVDTLMFPGWNGGGEWGGVGFDPKTHVAYINATDFGLTESLFKNTAGGGARSTYMRQCSACHGQDRAGAPPLIPPLVDIGKRLDAAQIAGVLQSGRGRMPPFPNLDAAASKALIQYLLNNGAEAEGAPAAADAPAQYDTTGYHAFLDPQGYPATSTPWGTLNAINLDTGEYLWKIPFGQYPDLVAQGMPDTGSENFGGPVITAGGVLFIGATTIDKKFRAFEMKTGKLLWETLLPYSATATPATYVVKGRQYVVIAAGGQRDPATPPGGVYVAYALPQ